MSFEHDFRFPYKLVVREFFTKNIVPDADHRIGYSRLVGLYHIWLEQVDATHDCPLEPSEFWETVCELVEDGKLPYEVVETKNHMSYLNGCRSTLRYELSDA